MLRGSKILVGYLGGSTATFTQNNLMIIRNFSHMLRWFACTKDVEFNKIRIAKQTEWNEIMKDSTDVFTWDLFGKYPLSRSSVNTWYKLYFHGMEMMSKINPIMLSTDIEQVGEQKDDAYTHCQVQCLQFTEPT